MGNLSNYYAKEGKQNPYTSTTGSTGSQSSSGGGLLQQYQKKNNLASPFSVVQNNTKPVQVTQPKSSPSLLSSAPQIISGIAKGINIGKLIITAATRQPTQPQVDVSKVALPTPQPQATPQKTISITPNQKILTPQQLKVVAPQPVAGQSATMKTAKPGSPTVVSRAAAVVPQTTAQVKDTAATVNEFIKSPSQFKSKATYDANNSTGLIEDIATRKITDFLHLPREAPAMIKSAIEAVAGPVGQGIALAMQERLSPPKTTGELVGLKAKQITNAITIGLTPINALFAAADKTPYVSELMRAVTIPFLAAGEVSTKASDKIIDALPISQQAKNNIKGPIGELAALTAQIVLGHTLAKISGKAITKLDDVGKEAFTKMTKDIVETSGGKTTVSFSPQDVRKVAIFNEGGKYHKELVDILADKGKAAGDLWTKAVKEGITIELPFEKVVGMIDKPWWGKIKKFLNAGVTDTTTTTQVPGRIVGPGTEGAAPAVPIEKQILGLLPENINHNPQAVINAVMKGGFEKTPEGKGLIKASLEAQQAGKDLTISLKPEAIKPFFTPEQILKMTPEEQAKAMADIQDKTQKAVYLKQDTEIPKVIKIGENYSTLTPEQTVALRNEVGIIPDGTAEAGQVHLNIQSEMTRGNNKEMALSDLANQYPDVKKALDNAGIKLEADKNIAAKESRQTKVIDQVSTPPEDALRQEALKYKSAEEFVKGYEQKLKNFDVFDQNNWTGVQRDPANDLARLQRGFMKVSQEPQYQKLYEQGKKDADVLAEIWNKANEAITKAPETSQAVTKPVVEKPIEFLAPQDMEAAKARIEARSAASAEMAAIPTNTEAQTPVGTGELKKSKAYTRVFDLLKEEFQQDVSYNTLNLKKDAKNAVDYIAKDPKSAIRIGLGLEQPPEGQTETAISIALAEKAATEGDYALQSRLESSRSLRQTRRGQEIVSERGRFEADSPHKYMRELLNKRLANLGANVKDALAETVNRATNVKQAAMDKIDSEAKKIKEAIKKDRKKIQMAQDIINSLICK